LIHAPEWAAREEKLVSNPLPDDPCFDDRIAHFFDHPETGYVL
jgi:hypothetical protein